MIESLYKPFQPWSRGGTIWIYSDPHFGDEELRAAIPNRPSDDELVAMINKRVGRNDTFICLGDVGNLEYVRKIRGYKVLVCGNHDAGGTTYERQIKNYWLYCDDYSYDEVIAHGHKLYPGQNITAYKTNNLINYQEEWHVRADNELFNEVYTGPLIISDRIILSHEPLDIDWMFNIHGHNHTSGSTFGHLNVCADVINYDPVNLNQFVKSGRLKECKSIHREIIDSATLKKQKKDRKSKV